jgi:hypothetical protein
VISDTNIALRGISNYPFPALLKAGQRAFGISLALSPEECKIEVSVSLSRSLENWVMLVSPLSGGLSEVEVFLFFSTQHAESFHQPFFFRP